MVIIYIFLWKPSQTRSVEWMRGWALCSDSCKRGSGGQEVKEWRDSQLRCVSPARKAEGAARLTELAADQKFISLSPGSAPEKVCERQKAPWSPSRLTVTSSKRFLCWHLKCRPPPLRCYQPSLRGTTTSLCLDFKILFQCLLWVFGHEGFLLESYSHEARARHSFRTNNKPAAGYEADTSVDTELLRND